ncbi:MAG: porin [Gammaproteobacteria bacterium]|nr:porin [Gammaproteobacteria bacterium]
MNLKASFIAIIASGVVATPLMAETEVETKGGIEATSGDFSFEFGGRIQLDFNTFDEDGTEMQDGFEFRRARLFAAGTLYSDWDYKAQYDFAGDAVEAKDLYIKYTGWDAGDITIGQFKQPFSLEELTSSKYITFMERALPNAFATGRRVGVGYNTADDNSTFAASFYGQSADESTAGDEGFGLGARYTFLPMKSENSLFHLGAAVAVEEAPDSATESVRFRQRMEAHMAERLVNTGSITSVDSITKVGVEGAWVSGPLSIQGEYIMADVARDIGSDVSFDGYYAFASYFLDGQTSRPYKKGSFGRVKASDVWELGLRLSSINLDDVSNGVNGGEMIDITLGANYYVNPNLRFMFNYVMSEVSSNGVTVEEPNAFVVRASFDF